MLRSSRFGNVRGAATGFAAAVLLLGTLGGSVAQAGGSLPLAGDQFVSGDGGPTDQVAAGTASHWNVVN